jgi:hypothetical protein
MASNDKYRYVPPSMQQAISKNMQQTLPPHLKKIQAAGGPMPAHAQQAIAQHMQKSLPPHMRQYASSYMQQNVVNQPMSRPVSPTTTTPVVPNSVPQGGFNKPRQDFFQNPSQQANSQFAAAPASPAPGYAPQQAYPPQAPQPNAYQNGYDFIMNPGTPPPQGPRLLNTSSMAIRAGIIGAGLVILMIIFMIVRSVFFGSNLTPFVAVLQSQQEVVRIATNAESLEELSSENENFALTTRMAVSTSQANLLDYMTLNKQKVGEKEIALKASAKTDETLEVAASAGTLDSTFREVMIEQLEEYQASLDKAYNETSGKRGRALLESDYKQTELLLTKLKADQSDN